MSDSNPTAGGGLTRARLKLVMRLGVMVVVGMVAILALGVLSRAMTDITTSEDTAAIFNVAAKPHPELIDAVEWRPDSDYIANPIPPLIREAVAEAWLRAWAQPLVLSGGSGPVGSSVEGEPTDGLAEYFIQSAFEAMHIGAQDWLGLPIHQISHDLQVTFYNDAGTVVGITAHEVRVLRAHPVGGRLAPAQEFADVGPAEEPSTGSGENDAPSQTGLELVDTEIAWYDSVESYSAVLSLENDNWRIHHMVRRAAEGQWAAEEAAPAPRPLAVDRYRAVTWRPTGPKSARFWSEPDLERAAADFQTIRDLSFDTVRIEIPFAETGGRDVTAQALSTAGSLMDLATENNLSVIVSLLGDRRDHQPLHWDADDDHIKTVIDDLGEHSALIMWELGSSPDLDLGVERVDQSLLDAWVSHIARTVRDVDHDTPLTVPWSSASAAYSAPLVGDIVSFIWSGLETPADIARLRDRAAGRPVVTLGSFHTSIGILPGGQTETEQARWHADMLGGIDRLGIDSFVVSSLRDVDVEAVAAYEQAQAEREHAAERAAEAASLEAFPPPRTPEPKEAGPEVHPGPVVAEVTWPTGPQASTGLLRADGSTKPAGAVFAPGADLDAVAVPSRLESLKKPFNLIMAVLSGTALGAWALLAAWSRDMVRLPALRSSVRRQRRAARGGKGLAAHILFSVTDVASRLLRFLLRSLERFRKVTNVTPTQPATITAEHSQPMPARQFAPVNQHGVTYESIAVPAQQELQPKPKRGGLVGIVGIVGKVWNWLLEPVTIPETASQADEPAVPANVEAPQHAPVDESATAQQFLSPRPTALPVVGAAQVTTGWATTGHAQPSAQLGGAASSSPGLADAPAPAPALAPTQGTREPGTIGAPSQARPPTPGPIRVVAAAEPDNHMAAPASAVAPPASVAPDSAPASDPGRATEPVATMAILDVDLTAIDTVVEGRRESLHSDVYRYAPFVLRAICIVTSALGDRPDQAAPVSLLIDRTGIGPCRIANAQQLRLSAIAQRVATPCNPADADATTGIGASVAVKLANGHQGGLLVTVGDTARPAITFVFRGDRPTRISDYRGRSIIANRSVGTLAVTNSATPIQAETYLELIRDVIETRDWDTELD